MLRSWKMDEWRFGPFLGCRAKALLEGLPRACSPTGTIASFELVIFMWMNYGLATSSVPVQYKQKKSAMLSYKCRPCTPSMYPTKASCYPYHDFNPLLIILTLQLRPTNPTLLIQLATKLSNRHILPTIQSHTMPPHTPPRPHPFIPLIPLKIILPGTPCVQRERNLRQPGANRSSVRLWLVAVPERLARVIPYPQRIPQRVCNSFCIERERRYGREGQ
jgi:hypothetical protein